MSEEPKHTITIRIRDLRRERSLTQEELAEALGISRQSVNAMEAGRCLPSLPIALQLATFFSVPLNNVFMFPESQVAANQLVLHKDASGALGPWSPLREMREALDELMDENTWQPAAATQEISAPAANIYQTAHDVVAELSLPGFRQEDLEIEVGEDFLTVSAQVSEPILSAERLYVRREFYPQSFSRTLPLPAIVESTKAEAGMKQGILQVRMPKMLAEKPKTSRISIKSLD